MNKIICENCGSDLLKEGFYTQAWNVFKVNNNGYVKYSHSDSTDDADVYCETCSESVADDVAAELMSLIGKNTKVQNIYWESFKKAENKSEFVIALANDFRVLIESKEPTYLEDKDFNFPELIDTVDLDEESGCIILENKNEIGYEDTLLCFQSILNGPCMLLKEDSLCSFFDLVFDVSTTSFIGDIQNKITPIEYDGVQASYYNETADDGTIFSGILFN